MNILIRCIIAYCLCLAILSPLHAQNQVQPEEHYLKEHSFDLSNSIVDTFTTSSLPIVIISTYGKRISRISRIKATMAIIDNEVGKWNSISDEATGYLGRISIKIRGNSSSTWLKKQYRIETQDSVGENLNVSLLGFPKENDWILNAPYIDKSFIRNVLTYHIASAMGNWASNTSYVELVLNNEFNGLYILMEKVKRDKNRIDIEEMTCQDSCGGALTGGYILCIDRGKEGILSTQPPSPGSKLNVFYLFEYPKIDDITEPQQNYISNFIFNFENTIAKPYSATYHEDYAQIIDIDSFVDYFIINELSKNVDGYRLSTYFYKDRDSKGGKLHMGPVWDFNLSYGLANYYDGLSTSGWELHYMLESPNALDDGNQVPFWWRRLLVDPEFTERIVERWFSLRNSVISIPHLHAFIDKTANMLKDPAKRNFSIWSPPGRSSKGFWPVPDTFYTFSTYQNEVDFLKDWLSKRIAWMDENMNSLVTTAVHEDESFIPRFTMSVAWPNPFNPARQQVSIKCTLPGAGELSVSIINIQGQIIDKQHTFERSQSTVTFHWDGRDALNRQVPSGIYFLIFQCGQQKRVTKVSLLR